MTSPTIIRSPGALDSAVAAFQQAFTLSRQLVTQRQQLELERQKVASQTNLESAQAGEVRARTTALDQQITDTNNKLVGTRIAMAHLGEDDKTFAQSLATGGFDETVAGYAQNARTAFQSTQADAANKVAQVQQTIAQTAQTAQQTAKLQRDATEASAIHDTLSRFPASALVNDSDAQQRAIIAVSAINVQKAQELAQAFAMTNSHYTPLFGPNGDLYVVNTRTGSVTPSKFNVGQRAGGTSTSGATRQAVIQLASSQALRALESAQALVRLDSKSGSQSAMASGLEDMGNAPVVGGLVRGFTAPAGQSMRTPHQRQFNMLMDRFSEHYLKMLPAMGPRGQNAFKQIIQAYRPPAGADDAETQRRAYEARDELINELRELSAAMRDGRQPDFTKLPGFNQAMVGNAQDLAQPQAPTGSQPVTPEDFHR